MAAGSYTTSTAFLEALAEAGVRYVFANLGSDHPGLIEAFARAKADGREDEFPRLIVCPHETVALSAAHAYAMVTGEPQAVIVHVDVGTQNLSGGVSNAMRGRVPVLIFAGAAPFTLEGELPGGRNEFIHWIQDVRDQRGILRNYVKYDNEIRTGRNVKQLVHRAIADLPQRARGPGVPDRRRARSWKSRWSRTPSTGRTSARSRPWLSPMRSPPRSPPPWPARSGPLVVTSYLGRDPAAVPKLVELCELLAIPVLESMAYHVNFPADHELHAGFQYHTVAQNPVLAQADVILAIDSDVPWIHRGEPAVRRGRYLLRRRRSAEDPDEHVARAGAALRRGQRPGGGGADRPVRARDQPRRPERGRRSGEKRLPAPTNKNWPNGPGASNREMTALSPRNTSPRASGGCWKTRTPWS